MVRAWATRGTNLVCRNGEVVLILGEDGSGKSRLLTTIAETILSPPTRTTTLVRGNVNIGGLDVLQQWDRSLLKKRFGLYLNDVRTTVDMSSIWAGATLDQIIEPSSSNDLSITSELQNKKKNAIHTAVEMTNLSRSLFSRLDNKLSAHVSPYEEDIVHTTQSQHSRSLSAPVSLLSPSDWHKLFVTKVLAQTLFYNPHFSSSKSNSQSTHPIGTVAIDKSLAGSILLLDNVMVHWDETDEKEFIENLRKSGAATLLTSNRWTLGRFADHIVVLKDGAVIESGTHKELLSKGPQGSMYAFKWSQIISM